MRLALNASCVKAAAPASQGFAFPAWACELKGDMPLKLRVFGSRRIYFGCVRVFEQRPLAFSSHSRFSNLCAATMRPRGISSSQWI